VVSAVGGSLLLVASLGCLSSEAAGGAPTNRDVAAAREAAVTLRGPALLPLLLLSEPSAADFLLLVVPLSSSLRFKLLWVSPAAAFSLPVLVGSPFISLLLLLSVVVVNAGGVSAVFLLFLATSLLWALAASSSSLLEALLLVLRLLLSEDMRRVLLPLSRVGCIRLEG